jgi:hypothetical protein
MLHFKVPMKLAAAALVAAIGAAGSPAHAALTINALTLNALTLNALTLNALTSKGSAIDELNGVAVETVTVSSEPSH